MLGFLARNGRWFLLASLFVGLASNTATGIVRPHLNVLIALLLFIACLRVGPQGFVQSWQGVKTDLVAIFVLQLALPLLVAMVTTWLELPPTTILITVLLTAAPALSGSPHLVTLLGYEPSPALRTMVLSTALLPFTVFPVLLLMPQIGNFADVAMATLRLALIIFAAAASAFFIRSKFLKTISSAGYSNIDGLATLALAIVVVGLMSAVKPLLLDKPIQLLGIFCAAVAVNFALQIVASAAFKKLLPDRAIVHLGVIAGNRNIALFLTALPAATTDPLLAFIGCYQVPMYVTPLIMQSYYRFIKPADTVIKSRV